MTRSPRTLLPLAALCAAALLIFEPHAAFAQSQLPPPRPPRPIVDPAASHPPDANDIMQINSHRASRRNFDVANAARLQLLQDDTAKLLILAGDLKARFDKLNGQKPSAEMLRELEVVELLAHDVQTKMKLTISAD